MHNTRIATPADRGYHIAYRLGRENTCPGCGGSSWHVGRITAECAVCLTAVAIQQQQGCQGVGLFVSRGHEGCDDGALFAVA